MTIYTSLIGGLGNQMFQYAAGRALSLRKNTELYLDISNFDSYGMHQCFELNRVFSYQAKIASTTEIEELLGWQSNALIRRILLRPELAPLRPHTFAVEPYFNYWPGINDLVTNCYLTGYWQSEKYFLDFSAQIRADFTFKLPLEKQNDELAKQISKVNAISLHVRRGDYASNPKTTATHGLCTLDYYRGSINYLIERIQNPHFYIFSDEINWVQENLKIDYPCTYVKHNRGVDSYIDMHLMSLCHHHIIANSSFSWWGAWLNPVGDKIVVAPKKWFANSTDVRDLLPDGWMTL